MDWEITYERLKANNWIVLLLLSAVSYFLLNPAQTLGTILGGLLIIVNFKVFQHTIHKAFSPDGMMKVGRVSIIAKYYLRLLILGIIIFFLINEGLVDPVGLAIGLSTVVISIFLLGISMALRHYREAS